MSSAAVKYYGSSIIATPAHGPVLRKGPVCRLVAYIPREKEKGFHSTGTRYRPAWRCSRCVPPLAAWGPGGEGLSANAAMALALGDCAWRVGAAFVPRYGTGRKAYCTVHIHQGLCTARNAGNKVVPTTRYLYYIDYGSLKFSMAGGVTCQVWTVALRGFDHAL